MTSLSSFKATRIPILMLPLFWTLLSMLTAHAQRFGGGRQQQQRIVGLQLLRAPSGQVLIRNLTNATVFYLNETTASDLANNDNNTDAGGYTIQAITEGSNIRVVRFGWNGRPVFRLERRPPFTLCGGVDGTPFTPCPGLLKAGLHSITAAIVGVGGLSTFRVQFRVDSGWSTNATNAPTTMTTSPSPSALLSQRPRPTSNATTSTITVATDESTDVPNVTTTTVASSPPPLQPVSKPFTRRPSSNPSKQQALLTSDAPLAKTLNPSGTNNSATIATTVSPNANQAPISRVPVVLNSNTSAAPKSAALPVRQPTQLPTNAANQSIQLQSSFPTMAPTVLKMQNTTSTPVAPINTTSATNETIPIEPPRKNATIAAAPANGATTIAPNATTAIHNATYATTAAAPTTAAKAPINTTNMTNAPTPTVGSESTQLPRRNATSATPTVSPLVNATATASPRTNATAINATNATTEAAPTESTPNTTNATNATMSTADPAISTELPARNATTATPTVSPLVNTTATLAPTSASAINSTYVTTLAAPVAIGNTTNATNSTMPSVVPVPAELPRRNATTATAAPTVPSLANATATLAPTSASAINATNATTLAPTAAADPVQSELPTNATRDPMTILAPSPTRNANSTSLAPRAAAAATTATPTVFVPTRSPVVGGAARAPTKAPTLVITPTTTVQTPSSTSGKFEPVLINCGSDTLYIDTERRAWLADSFVTGGAPYTTENIEIAETEEDGLFNTYRFGESTYEISVPNGLYEVVLWMAETYFDTEYIRIFDVLVESTWLKDVDIVDLGGGLARLAIRKVTSAIVVDGSLSIAFRAQPYNNEPLISALEINRIGQAPPTRAPVVGGPPPSLAPMDAEKPESFSTIRINCGGKRYTDSEGRKWSTDRYSQGGSTHTTTTPIVDTQDPDLYQSERWGESSYEIPVPLGNYEVILRWAEIYYVDEGLRTFGVDIESGEERIKDLDIVKEAGGPFKPFKKSVTVPVVDGHLSIKFLSTDPEIGSPTISALEIRRVGNHYAHAVIGGPYITVDSDGNGHALVNVDASQSHTHGPSHTITAYTWREGNDILGTGKVTALNLTVGEHEIILTIVDSSGSISSDRTTATVRLKGFPELFSISPSSGDIAGGTVVTLSGQNLGNATSVLFGRVALTGSAITVLDAHNISVVSPGPAIGVPVKVSVVTTVGVSNTADYTFISSTPIAFAISKLLSLHRPTAIAFGPDGKLYVGTQDGKLARITLNDSYDVVVSSVMTTIDSKRCILGLAFDPLDVSELPSVYFTSSYIYHGERRSTFGLAINGKVQKAHGPSLEFVTNIVTGLPVSEIDHAVNGIYFGDHGELYIGVGSNTNAGVPSGIMGSGTMKENYFSGAVLVAHLGHPKFSGTIRYSAMDDGDPVSGIGLTGVEVFGAGTRNPYGIWKHSNGNVYATDNGPNADYGSRSTGCNEGDELPGVSETDKLLLVEKGGYYGHANRKRGQTDPRQCVWRSNTLNSSDISTTTDNTSMAFTAPLMRVRSSTCGIIEFESDHFDGQMRGDLILSKYNSDLYRVVLDKSNGRVVNIFTDPAVALAGNGGLAVTQAPDGSLIDARHTDGECYLYKPIETAPSTVLDIKSVFPRRGGLAGGSKFMIFGVNFMDSARTSTSTSSRSATETATEVSVTVGGRPCTNVAVVSERKIECLLPPGTVGRKDVIVSIMIDGTKRSDTFVNGYRYITGLPAEEATEATEASV